MEDKEYQKLVKKSRQRQTKKIVGVYGITLSILAILGLIFLSVYHVGPFQGEKVAGLRNDQIKSSEQPTDVGSLLFDQVAEIKMNSSMSRLAIYVDFYEKDRLVETAGPLDIGATEEEKGKISGTLMYGVPTGEKRLVIDFVREGFTTRGTIDFADYLKIDTNDEWSTQLFYFDGSEEIETGKKYYFYLTHTGDSVSLDMTKNLSKESLKKSEQTIAMYMVYE